MKKIIVKDWKINYDGKALPCSVPGDITWDMYKNGVVQDPFYGWNHVDIRWVAERDFDYTAEIVVDKETVENDVTELVFDGIDTFSDIYLNGVHLGATKNMFLQYRFNVKGILKEGKNLLKVSMHSTLKKMDEYDAEGYFSIFNEKRLFIRKAQCHFGWDWAPDMPGYGIWQDVYLEVSPTEKINDIFVVPDDKGNVTFFTELNYNIRPFYGPNDTIVVPASEMQGDTLHYYVSDTPFGTPTKKASVQISGKKNVGGVKLQNYELWWPLGYGKHPLYNYKVELERNGKIIDVKEGRFAFRSVRVLQEPKADNILGYAFEINGKEVVVKGSNWVPTECFTGIITDQKYKDILSLAEKGNFNTLRVWGGGIYEKDIFYDLCDEKGIMVWQDMMLACADLVDDQPDWVENITKEVEYQVKRLRNHPCLIVWNGGNEKTGTYGFCITKGDYFEHVVMRGLVTDLDWTRPFSRQSPFSYTDVGNDVTSGESHHNSFEIALREGMDKYRSLISSKIVPFISESALQGPNSLETTKKIFPEKDLWPLNELWNDRLMDNPYAEVRTPFAQRQFNYATDLYGTPKNLNDFTAKGMLVHAEAMRAECEFARSNKGKTAGFLNWMFGDIWPTGSWAIVDYYLEPKQAYYQMRRSYAPLLVTFAYDGKNTNLVVVNDSFVPFTSKIVFGQKTLDGKTVFSQEVFVKDLVDGIEKIKVEGTVETPNTYLFAKYVLDGTEQTNVYSYNFWKNLNFESDYSVKTESVDANTVKITVKANKFAKSVYISKKDNFKYEYSDNYLDIEAGAEKTVFVTGRNGVSPDGFTVTDFAEMTK